MVTFTKLKLYGFKSFVDKTELEIGPGLNGIVGPNGCGKSNLVESLRWVMGEKSAKNMRGSGMEDVIFAGTSKRPARNMAEVTVVMDNSDNTAPAPFNTATEIEINRRIEKDKGSQYRVNGKAVRARDVNLLFADTMTGASSPALVSQGRITEIITAKPADRRKILEDSAGISGLHTRRHEAELRLRAAEQNLTRLDDSLGDMRSRLSSLKRQTRQAERYKELSDTIRRLEMGITWQTWRDIHAKIKQDRDSFATANEQVQEGLKVIQELSGKIETLESILPDERKKHMEASAVLQNFKVSLERLEQDIQSKAKGLQDAEQAKTDLERDCEFAKEQQDKVLNDIEDVTTRLDDLNSRIETIPADINAAQTDFDKKKSKLDQKNQEKQKLETEIAVITQTQDGLEKQRAQQENNLARLRHNISTLVEAIENSTMRLDEIKNDEVLNIDLDALETEQEALQNTLETLSQKIADQKESVEATKEKKETLQADIRGMQSEIDALQSMIDMNASNDDLPQGDDALLTHLDVSAGYEKAVSSVLGHWLSMASMNADSASVYWTETTVSTQAPKGLKSLNEFVKAPKALIPLLQSAGIVDNLDEHNDLAMGQMIVTRDGAFKRWDGLTVQASAAQQNNSASNVLEHKNRIAELQKTLDVNEVGLTQLETAYSSAIETLEILENEKQETQKSYQDNANFITENRYKIERVQDQIKTLDEKLNDQNTRLTQNKNEEAELEKALNELIEQMGDGADTQKSSMEERVNIIAEDIQSLRTVTDEAQHKLIEMRQSQNHATQQEQALELSLKTLESDKTKLSMRQDDLFQRLELIEAKIIGYRTAAGDENTDAMREELLNKITDQQQSMEAASLSLETQEKSYRDLQSELRGAEGNIAAAREKRAVAQTNVSNAEEELSRIQHEIAERFELIPQTLEERVYSLFENGVPETHKLNEEKEVVTRQRDGIGPVNLRAAIESEETETQLAEMEVEHTDLTKAIEQLRSGIAKLNREAKERLAIAFTRVDGHFQKLFAQLFEGGRAYLQMIESDDPLESGLEIFAQPPGKALQKLSLLSGGEQTLTATALIFGMFMTNPSPICVLDEIDAPLDDANVDRVCSLMETIVRETSTRFIVITHHRMTMARMDRLYGVTMAERGVSQLVSVDMALQEEMELSESA